MIVEKAYAKVNLGLKVVGKRHDGYHNLEMVNASIDLADELAFQNHDITNIVSNKEVCKLEDNLIYKTIKLMQKEFHINQEVLVNVIKNIPMGAGLAGGSSDAAATIRALNKLWDLKLSARQMYDIALQIGSDVPFCLTGKLAYVSGRGEIIEPLNTKIEARLILVFPNYSCSTKQIFNEYHYQSNYNIESLINAIYQKDLNSIGKAMHNDLEIVVNKLTKVQNLITIVEIKEALNKYNPDKTVMSGSGSTVISLVENDTNIDNLIKKLEGIYPTFHILVSKFD